MCFCVDLVQLKLHSGFFIMIYHWNSLVFQMTPKMHRIDSAAVNNLQAQVLFGFDVILDWAKSQWNMNLVSKPPLPPKGPSLLPNTQPLFFNYDHDQSIGFVIGTLCAKKKLRFHHSFRSYWALKFWGCDVVTCWKVQPTRVLNPETSISELMSCIIATRRGHL